MDTAEPRAPPEGAQVVFLSWMRSDRVAHLINNLTDDINEIPHETTMFHHRGSARVERTIFEKTTAR